MLISQLVSLALLTVLPPLSLMASKPAWADYIRANPQNVFIISVENATHNINEAPVITDFDWFHGDKIGLTGGLTEEDLDYQLLIDFNNDGFANDTVIRLRETQEILGVVINADDFVLDGEFIPVSSYQIKSCMKQDNILNCNFNFPQIRE
ncbi:MULTISPECIES: hypothetical protein [Limnospira]|uniref:Uncharacterized protein n=1 Tax=Limnospira indica PCC 8005 TaxID=376219 RepID=A0A9P1KGR7_9CYAN|nr:hypothetical protein [Limnospira indica]CDM95977.1 conserved hypothetical protein (secreted) [Limnospira indica PCC 8005]